MKKYKIKLPRLNPTAQLIAASLLFIATTAVSGGQGVSGWEVDLFRFVYEWPEFLRPIFFVITQFGSIHVFGILLVLYLLRKNYHVMLRLIMTGTLAYLLTGFAKDIWGRDRPNDFLTDIANLDYIVRGPGYPSGHTALATALALTVWHYLPRKYHWVVPVWIIGVGLSRMYLGIHFPLDLLGGFAIGWASYAAFRHVRLYDINYRRPTKKPSAKVKVSKKS